MGIEERKIVKGRGLSKKNQFLLKAYDLLFETEKVMRKKLVGIKSFNKDDLYWLLKVTDYLHRNEQSADQFVDHLGYSGRVKKLIAEGWELLDEAETLFREEWYRGNSDRKKNRKGKGTDYLDMGKAILKMPESKGYHEEIKRQYEILGKNTRPQFGKKKSEKQIYRNFEEYIQYLREIQGSGEVSKEQYPGGDFYNAKKFDCMAVMAAHIRKVLAEPTEAEKKKIQDTLQIKGNSFLENREVDGNYFSIDEYIKKRMMKRRDGYGVAINAIPALEVTGSGDSSKS